MIEKNNFQAESEPGPGVKVPPLRMIAWEVTRSCNLNCVHCRAAAGRGPYTGELTTDESIHLIDEIVSFSQPVIILTGGEPLLRGDIYDLARYGTNRTPKRISPSPLVLHAKTSYDSIICSENKRFPGGIGC